MLLKTAILLFILDVGLRRIQIDGEEWRRVTQTLRRWIFFWQGVPRPAQAEESLAALLARRDQVRSSQTAPVMEPKPELFQPASPVVVPLSNSQTPTRPASEPTTPQPEEEPAEQTTTTTSRLLEAKRRAQQRRR